MGNDDKLRSLGRHQENSAVLEQKSKHVRSNLIGLERQVKEQPGSGGLVDGSISLKLMPTTEIFQDIDCSQIDQDHFVLGNVSSKENTVYSQSEQSSESKNFESNGQLTRS